MDNPGGGQIGNKSLPSNLMLVKVTKNLLDEKEYQFMSYTSRSTNRKYWSNGRLSWKKTKTDRYHMIRNHITITATMERKIEVYPGRGRACNLRLNMIKKNLLKCLYAAPPTNGDRPDNGRKNRSRNYRKGCTYLNSASYLRSRILMYMYSPTKCRHRYMC